MAIPFDEQETSFLIDRINPDFVECYSCDAYYVRRLKKIAESLGVEYTIPYEGAIRVTLPVECVLLREPPKKREMTDEQRDAARSRFQKMWEERRGQQDDNEDEITDDQ